MDWWPGRDLPVIPATSGMEKQWRRWMDVWFEQKSCVDSRTLCQDADWMKFLPHVSTTLGFVWKVKLVSLCFIKLLRLLEKYSFQSVCAGWLYLGYLWCRKKRATLDWVLIKSDSAQFSDIISGLYKDRDGPNSAERLKDGCLVQSCPVKLPKLIKFSKVLIILSSAEKLEM